jgi:hypothetical protein
MPIDESAVDRALVRVCSAERTTRGTGFLVADDLILTCAHVVIDGPPMIEAADGRLYETALEIVPSLAAIDLALLRCKTAIGVPLPLATTAPVPMPFWSKGFQLQSAAIRDAVPIEGLMPGTTTVVYGSPPVTLEDVLVLTNADIGHGMSGAPVLDREWGAVLGVVNTRFRMARDDARWRGTALAGFAVSLDKGGQASSELRALVQGNRRTVRAYGPYLNALAATDLCRNITSEVLENLDVTGRVLPTRYCERTGVTGALMRFLVSEAPILAIVGRSGVGKTAEFAHLSRRSFDRDTAVLLGGSSLGATRRGVHDDLERRFADVISDGGQFPGLVKTVVAALHEEGRRLLVLIDGLNEGPAAFARSLPDWFASSLRWLRESGAKLIFSTRPESWDDIARLLPSKALHDGGALLLDDFDDSEAEAAMRAYDLTGRVGPDDIRHPFMARIYWELAGEGATVTRTPSRYAVMERFIQLKAADTARGIGVVPLQVRVVMGRTAAALDAMNLTLSRHALADLFEHNGPILGRLLRENVLVPAVPSSDFRFASDQIAEFLQSEALTDVQLQGTSGLAADVGARRLSPSTLAFGLLRLERTRGAAAVLPLLQALIDEWQRSSSWLLGHTLEEVFGQSPDVGSLYPALERFVEASPTVPFRTVSDLSMVRRLDLTLTAKFALLRILARRERSWEWEHKRWDAQDFQSIAAERRRLDALELPWGLLHVIADLVEVHGADALSELERWMDDRHTLSDGRVTVGDVARGLLYRLAPAAFGPVCELLAAHEASDPFVLHLLANKYPEAMIEVAERWALQPQQQRLAALCARTALGSAGSGPLASEAVTLLRRLLDASPETRLEAWGGLYRDPRTRGDVVKDVLAAFVRGERGVSANLVLAGDGTHEPLLVKAFRDYFDRPDRTQEQIGDALVTLATRPEPAELTALLVERLEHYWEPRSGLEWSISLAVEYLLYRIADSPLLKDRILALADRVAREGSDNAREHVAYFATAKASRKFDSASQMQIFESLLASAGEHGLTSLIGMIDDAGGMPWAVDRVLATARADEQQFEHDLLAASAFQEGFADVLAARLALPGSVKPQFSLKTWLQRISEGSAPRQAANEMLEEFLAPS